MAFITFDYMFLYYFLLPKASALTQVARSGAPICLLEVKTPYEAYLNGLDKQEIINLKDQQQQLNKYCGLKIGDLETANNNAGNWE